MPLKLETAKNKALWGRLGKRLPQLSTQIEWDGYWLVNKFSLLHKITILVEIMGYFYKW